MAPLEQRPIHKSEIARNEAQAESFLAERDKRAAEAKKATVEAELVKLDVNKKKREETKELAKDEHHFVYVFDKEVTDATAKLCINQLANWERTTRGPVEVELVINSPGGSVFDGFALIDYINGMHARGHTVNTYAYGKAASMAGVLLQAGKKRTIGQNALILIHEASFGAIGSFGKVEDQVKLVEIMHERILSLLADRSSLSKASMRRRWRRRDWWLDAAEALKLGLVDEVR